ncbi:MAG: hypothetical protein PHX18_03985 [Candidatus Gastranaerophilales bacterium]|nr:hypothetical protein [Candidatus Gastranaerophilales bacterium]
MTNDFFSYWQARYDVYTPNTKTTARTSTFKYVTEDSSTGSANGSGTTTPPPSTGTTITPNPNETAAAFITRYAQAKGLTEAQAKAEILADYGNIETKEDELKTLEDDIKEQEAELTKWQARLEGATGTQIKVYQNQVNSNQKDLDTLKATLESLQKEVDFYKSVSAFAVEETTAPEETEDTTET